MFFSIHIGTYRSTPHAQLCPSKSRAASCVAALSIFLSFTGCAKQTYYPEYAQPPCSISKEQQAHLFQNLEERGLEEALEYPKIYLSNFCAGLAHWRTREFALNLKFRHQYPHMSNEEIRILVEDAINQEGPPGPPEHLQPTRELSCTSNQIGSSTYTDCN